MKKLKGNIFLKIGIIIALIIVLLIPTTMVKSLIREREYVQEKAIKEVSSKWGNGQTVSGPFISVPFDRYVSKFNVKDSINEIVKIKEWAHFLPEQLNITGVVNPEKRYRGIYEVVVYESKLKIEGDFNNIDFKQFDVEPKNIHFDKAFLTLGITDLKGIEKQISLHWNQDEISFNSGTATNHIVSKGINAHISLDSTKSKNYQFSTEIDLKGSQSLYFVPVGKTTNVTISSNWNTPSFTGTYLPDSREVTNDGFTSNWNILHLNRNYPQQWLGSHYSIKKSSFGTDLLLPVDNYKKSYRVAKYAVLFLVLTFITFFFVEIMRKVFIHPIQYLLVGIALIVFYTLLLSFSEHITFNYSYVLAMILTLSLISYYISAVLKSRQVGGLIFGILLIMYTFIFVIIQLEDYALLIGSVGMFVILGLVMYFSRKIDWYNVKIGSDEDVINKDKKD